MGKYISKLAAAALLLALLDGCAARRPSIDMQAGQEPPPSLADSVAAAVRQDVERETAELMRRRAETIEPALASVERQFDLLHTRLDLRPRFDNQTLEGEARLTLRPYFYAFDSLHIDAKGFRLDEVALVTPGGRLPLRYRYDSLRIHVRLDRQYAREDSFTVYIRYVAQPESLKTHLGEAIGNEKGLYFINPDGSDPHKPRQFWTQSQAQAASCWFPTLDQTNERQTSEIRLTVDDSLTTLSNGLLVEATRNADGSRTDVWRMDLPHAPYLFMIAGGKFAVVKDQWRGREVSYYVEPQYEPYARLIFGNTPEMLDFFSATFGMDFPWPKYSQIVVRDFVSGAMENTTAVVHMEGLQHDAREHLDATEEEYISHELTHHWFGDYVTCESWSHTTLNEAFATYGEILWKHHKYGLNEAQKHYWNDVQLYLSEASMDAKRLIRFQYEHPDEMFDRHSYQKGSCVLHMLRGHLGDEAFFTAIRRYLRKHALSPVEADELRLVFEEVSGRDLRWFFDQWFYDLGHPLLEIDYQWSEDEKLLRVRVQQKQGEEKDWRLFRLPTSLRVQLADGSERRLPFELSRKDTTISLRLDRAPVNADIDPERSLLCERKENKPAAWWLHQLRGQENYLTTRQAAERLMDRIDSAEVAQVWTGLLNHPETAMRELALPYELGGLIDRLPKSITDKMFQMARADASALLRYAALEVLSTQPPDSSQWLALLRHAVNDSSYSVSAFALHLLHQEQPQEGLAVARRMKNTRNSRTRNNVARILLQENEPGAAAYFTEAVTQTPSLFQRMFLLQEYAQGLNENSSLERLEPLMAVAKGDASWIMRAMAARMLVPHRSRPEVQALLDSLRSNEKNEQLREIYQGLY